MSDTRIYAIGDVHGHLDKLREVHRWIKADQTRHQGAIKVVHIGDLVDRGPDSAGVITYLMEGVQNGKPWVVLKGNHDRMMALFLETEPGRDHQLRAEYEWISPQLGGLTTLESYGVGADSDAPKMARWLHPKGGGPETLVSYGVDGKIQDMSALHRAARAAVPAEHLAFLKGLPVMFRTETAVFVHAGIRPGTPIEDQIEDDLVWIRQEFLNDRRDHGPLIIHGHTPVRAVEHYGNRVNIDTGAGMGKELSVVVLEGRAVWKLGRKGRTPVVPA